MWKNPKVLGIIISGTALVFVIFILLSPSSLGSTATSLESPRESCSAPKLNVEVNGEFSVKDGSVIGIEPEIQKIEDVGIKFNPLAVIEPFNIEVIAVDGTTNEELDTFRGVGSLSSSSDIENERFNLNYNLPDKNCDGIVDNHDLDLKITITETEDISEDSDTKFFTCKIRNGGIAC